MEDAVARFRSRMEASNREYLAARIAEQLAQPLSEASRVNAMSRVWFRWEESHKAWKRIPPPGDDASPELRAQCDLECSVETLDDVAKVPHYHMDGTEPPFDENTRSIFMSALEAAIRENADFELLGSDDDIRPPDELGQFLALTKGAFDPDFRHSGMCDFSPPCYDNVTEEVMRNALERYADTDEWEISGAECLRDEFDVAAGIMFNQAGKRPDLWPEHVENKWLSFYALCRPADAEDESWTWRVIFYNKLGGLEYDVVSFQSIPAFLDWYSSWDSRTQDDNGAEGDGDEEGGNEVAKYRPGEGFVE